VAERGGHLARLVELDELGVQVGRRLEREHGALSAGHDNGVEGDGVDLVDRPGVLDELHELGIMDVPATDDVFGLPLAGVLGVGHAVGLARATIGAEDLDLVARLDEVEVRMGELGPPEPDGPATGGRHRGVRNDDSDPLGLYGVDRIQRLVTHR
jgi:hypothetical protein